MRDIATTASSAHAAKHAKPIGADLATMDGLIEYGSPLHRVADYLLNGDNEHISRRDAATICNVHVSMVDDLLQPGVLCGVLAFGNDNSAGRVWRAGLRLGTLAVPPFPTRRVTLASSSPASRTPQATTLPAPAAPAAPAPRAARPAAAGSRGGRRNRLPELDAAALQVIDDMAPRGAIRRPKGLTRYDDVFDRLTKPGSGTLIDKSYRAALGKAVIAYSRRTGRKFSIFTCPDGAHCAVRREA